MAKQNINPLFNYFKPNQGKKSMLTKTLTKTKVKPITTMLIVVAVIIAGAAFISSASLPVASVIGTNSFFQMAAEPLQANGLTYNGTIYYVDSSIVDTNVGSATPDFTTYDPLTFSTTGGTASVYKTIADLNLKSFAPGDAVLFRRGQTWREQLMPRSSGSAGNPITFGAYGDGAKPRITAADLVTEMFLTATANVYSKTGIIITPLVATINGVLGTKKSSLEALAADNDWYFSANTLYVYSTSDITSKTVEIGVRDKVTANNGKSYITFQGLALDSGNHSAVGSGVYVSGVGATGVVIDDCDIKHNLYGVLFFTTNAQAGGHTIANSLIHDNRASGIHLNAGTDGSTDSNRTHIYKNQIYNNVGFGILAYTSYWLIENNTIYNNGDHVTAAGWSGIHVWGGPRGTPTAGAGDNNIIRYNTVSGTLSRGEDGSGIGVDMYADNNQIYYNVTYSNDGPGISLSSDSGNKIYNNTSYGNCLNRSGELTMFGEIRVYGQAIQKADNFAIKNNIAYATQPSTYAIWVNSHAYNQNPDITNNIWYTPNVMYWYYWNTSNPPVGTVWNNLTGVGTDFNTNPSLVNVATLDFHLKKSAPAINKGIDVGLTTDFAGNALSGAPDIGAYEYQGR